MTAALGLPMKKREGLPTTYSVPVARRTPKIHQIKVEGAFKPEPALSGEDYDEILRIMKNMVQVMELSPQAFHGMGEEDLRRTLPPRVQGRGQGPTAFAGADVYSHREPTAQKISTGRPSQPQQPRSTHRGLPLARCISPSLSQPN